MKKRLKNKKGFTLVELLVALLIAAMAGMIALGGLVVGANAYRDIQLKSEAQMLMKGYMDSFRSILTTASPDSGFEISVPGKGMKDEGRVYLPNEKENCAGYFTLKTYGSGSDTYNAIVFQPVNQTPQANSSKDSLYEDDDSGKVIELVVQRMARDFTAKLENFSYNTEDNYFSGKITLTSRANLSSGDPLSISEEFKISPLNYHK